MPLSLDRLEHLVARSTDIVVATDRDGNVAYYNDGASRILGYSPDEILGKYVAVLYPDLAEAKRVMAAMRDPEHGGPCRLVAPGQACYFSVKWVERILVTAERPQDTRRQGHHAPGMGAPEADGRHHHVGRARGHERPAPAHVPPFLCSALTTRP